MKVRTYKPGSDKDPKVKIEDFDSWNCDHTIALVAAPLLKQLKKNNHGFALVEDCDAPEEISSKNAAPFDEDSEWDDNASARWDYVMDEMIFAMEHIVDDTWEGEFFGEWIESDSRPLGGHFESFDFDGLQEVEERINNGCRLFGKYFRSLWD